MKKLYIAVVVLVAASLGWCVIKAPTVPEVATWDTLMWETLTWGETTWVLSVSEILTWEIISWAFDSWVVSVLTGSEWVDVNTGVTAEVKGLIDERANQPQDASKLTEEDISLMEKIIEKLKSSIK